MDRSSTDLLAAASLPVIMSASWSPPSENQIFANLFPKEKKWTTMTTMHNYNNNPSDFSGVATLCCSTWMVAMFLGYEWCESEYIGAGKQQKTECNIDAMCHFLILFFFIFFFVLFYFRSVVVIVCHRGIIRWEFSTMHFICWWYFFVGWRVMHRLACFDYLY